MKKCSKCKDIKSEDNFYRGANYCKPCKKLYNLENKTVLSAKRSLYHIKNKEKENQRNNQYYEENKSERKKYYEEHKAHFHEYYLKSNYGSLEKQIKALLVRCKKRANKYKMSFDLNDELILKMYNNQNGTCRLTGIDFDLELPQSTHMRPFSMSIDRVDNNLGYTKDNVRLVCSIVNFAINEFGLDNFDKMCLSYVEKKNL